MAEVQVAANPAPSPTLGFARPDDLSSLSQLHAEAFPGFFLTQLGIPFIREYYRLVLEYSDGILVVVSENGALSGFAAGFVDPSRFNRFMIRHGGRLVLHATRAIFAQPTLLARCVTAAATVVAPATAVSLRPPEPYAELSSLAVRPLCQGRGVGQQLVASFCREAGLRGARFVCLTTDAVCNERTNSFYEHVGFERVGSESRRDDRRMNVYWAGRDGPSYFC